MFEGYSEFQVYNMNYSMDDVQYFVFDSVVPGLCSVCQEEVMDVEPDAHSYDCDSCGSKETVDSVLILLELV